MSKDADVIDAQGLEEVKRAGKELVSRKCMVCGKPALYCMRGLEKNSYCKSCAQDHFKLLSYLEKLP